MELEHVLIVGGGMAGLHTARLLREKGYAGRLTMLSAEAHLPYDRPPLSKAVLAGKVDSVDELAFPMDFAAARIDIRLGERGVAWEPGSVTSSSGAVLAYDALVVATGSEPVRIPVAYWALTLRSYEDSVRLRAELRPGRRVAIVGAGWIGAEVATAARHAGCDVRVLEAQDRPLAAIFPEMIGKVMAGWYQEANVSLAL
jgi:3-phenylpropionate/trans-cinnamate dioxygenase ferredoxin reductase subunit